jgi:hypothetical protein
MKSTLRLGLALIALYAAGVLGRDQLVRYAPKISRFFHPPFFQFSRAFTNNTVSPFRIGMRDTSITPRALDAGLTERKCFRNVRIQYASGPPARCFEYSKTGIYWNVWVSRGEVTVVHVFSTFNLTSE